MDWKCGVSMKVYFEEIVRSEESRYIVRVSTKEPSSEQSFVFHVTGNGIRVVGWSEDFERFMSHNIGPAKYLLQAILAFDRSQGVEIGGISGGAIPP